MTANSPKVARSLAALLPYLSPLLSMLVGSLAGVLMGGDDAAMALGAGSGFVAALVIARIAIALPPGWTPAVQPIPVFNHSTRFVKE